jgi:acetylornithine deacetylase/succinyl-diaminopimelate desuccinylase-like protein
MAVDESDVSTVQDTINNDLETHISRLQRVIRQPSLSVDGVGLTEISELFVDLLNETGAEEAELVETEGAPGVWGYYDAGADTTVVTYGMLDTRLVTNESEWEYSPFGAERTEIDPYGEVVVGRITAKGALACYLSALEATRDALGELPVNVMILAEPEEIRGSPHYYEMLEQYEDRIRSADACYGPGFSQNDAGNVSAALGYKSAIYFDLEVAGEAWGYGPQGNDVHAMSNAVLDSPAWRLVKAMSCLVEDDGREIAIDGYYDQYDPPTEKERKEVREYVESLDGEAVWKQAPGLTRGSGEIERLKEDLQKSGAVEVFLQAFYGPESFNIQGVRSGFLGPETGTRPFRLPHEGSATFDMRMPRNFDPEVMLEQTRNHLDEHGYEDVVIDVAAAHEWSRTDRDAGIVNVIEDVLAAHGADLQLAPYSCGGVPWAAFQSRYDIPMLHGVGLGYQGSDGVHEFISIDGTDDVASLAVAERSFAEILMTYGKR